MLINRICNARRSRHSSVKLISFYCIFFFLHFNILCDWFRSIVPNGFLFVPALPLHPGVELNITLYPLHPSIPRLALKSSSSFASLCTHNAYCNITWLQCELDVKRVERGEKKTNVFLTYCWRGRSEETRWNRPSYLPARHWCSIII